MTLTYCDVCGVQINLDGPQPTHYSLTMSHYNPMAAWDSKGPHWTHLCMECTSAVREILDEFAKARPWRGAGRP